MLSAAIIHAPWKEERANNVRELLVEVPFATVIADDDRVGRKKIANRLGCWPMAERAWRASAGSHHLVLEDDAQLCDGFLRLVLETVSREPWAAVSFFSGSRSCSVATVMPTFIVDRWLRWTRWGSQVLPHHDWLIDAGLQDIGARHLRSVPSLVDHLAFDSLLEHEHVRATHYEQRPTHILLTRPATCSVEDAPVIATFTQ